ncbi:MAG TPA: glycosyltransferase family 2 protein [Patescibacteria group bacterium]|nr:glycosyltransferase family 2 protein [Patescibacteria group bacterium]
MTNSKFRVSLVIPVYNEESYLALCLESIAAQTVRPFEVIVVDNNSTDSTVAVAQRFPFVTVLHEPRQGVVYARDCGFNAARGDIIGRTDGDTILSPDWVAQLQQAFAEPTVDATSGTVDYRDIGFKAAFDVIDTRFRHYLANRMEKVGELFLYGVTMGIRRSAWESVRGELCHEREFAEDLDLAAHLSHLNFQASFTPMMRATIAPRQAASGPREFFRYVWSCPHTYIKHGMVSQRYMYAMVVFVIACYLPIRLLYAGYNPMTQRFSLAHIFRSDVRARVSPVSELI